MVLFHTKTAYLKSSEVPAMTVEKLKEELKSRNLATNGKKADLVSRLQENILALAGGSDEGKDHDEPDADDEAAAAAAKAAKAATAGATTPTKGKGKKGSGASPPVKKQKSAAAAAAGGDDDAEDAPAAATKPNAKSPVAAPAAAPASPAAKPATIVPAAVVSAVPAAADASAAGAKKGTKRGRASKNDDGDSNDEPATNATATAAAAAPAKPAVSAPAAAAAAASADSDDDAPGPARPAASSSPSNSPKAAAAHSAAAYKSNASLQLRSDKDEKGGAAVVMRDDDDAAGPAPAKNTTGAAAAAVSAAADVDSDDDFGPVRPGEAKVGGAKTATAKPKWTAVELGAFALHASRLPTAEMYEKSYMHRDVLTQINVTAGGTDFVVTASVDGHLKFWKKIPDGIEFVKQFKAHLGPIIHLSSSPDGFLLCSISTDKAVKIFDVVTFDMIHMIRLPYVPLTCEWIHAPKSARARIAITDSSSGDIRVYKPEGGNEPIQTIKLHNNPVTFLQFNAVANIVISIDANGFIEYWNADSYEFPTGTAASSLKFRHKTETDLYEFVKNKTVPTSLSIAPNGKYFATMGRDRMIRVFAFGTGKLFRVFDEGLATYEKQQLSENPLYKLDNIDFGRRMAIEREIDKAYKAPEKAIVAAATGASLPPPASNVIFDESGTHILYPTMMGIKIVNVLTNKLTRVLGKVENTERFLQVALFQGIPKTYGGSAAADSNAGLISASGNAIAVKQEDPTIFCTAYKKNRFYWFSKREPKEDGGAAQGRDVFNEKPLKEATKLVAQPQTTLGSIVVMHTTMGDITLELFKDDTPKAFENFTTHAKNGYYNNTTFHRVIKDFMIQAGDPQGDGTGGESIWGLEFEDEIVAKLKHDRAGVLSMANAGANSNNSQFFITTVPCPWLDGKHTVFGRVTKGMDVVHSIEKAPTRDSRPIKPIKVINIDLQK